MVSWRLALIVLAGFLIYANALSGPLIFDDFGTIAANPQITDLGDLRRVFSPPPESPVGGRPLVNLSFAINYALGGLDVRGYHVVNLLIHITCGLLVFGLVRRTLELPSLGDRVGTLDSGPGTLAFAVALLWTLHPLNSEVVNYLSQRTESMMALCYLLTLYASLRALASPRSAWWQAAAVLSSAAGMACKESMVSAP